MRNTFVVVIVAIFLCGSMQTTHGTKTDQAAVIDFTSDGWREFMQWLEGYLDGNGAPTGSSLFTLTGDPVVKRQENGVTRLTIPGILKQESKNAGGGISKATYRVTIDVQVGGNPFKIQHLKTIICVGVATQS